MHAGDVNDELLTTTQASKVTLVGEPEVDLSLLKLGRRRETDLSSPTISSESANPLLFLRYADRGVDATEFGA